MNPSVRLVTVANKRPIEPHFCYDEFFASLQRQNIVPLILGTLAGQYTGLCSKPRLLLEAINSGWIKEGVTIFVDCFDLVFIRSVEQIVGEFLNWGVDIVIGAEKNCFPDDLRKEFDAAADIFTVGDPTPYKYLNSGFIIAKTAALKTALELMELECEPDDHRREDGTNFHCNDQYLWMKLFCDLPRYAGKIEIDLDYYQEFCMNMHDVAIDEFSLVHEIGTDKPCILNKDTNSMPAVVHFNGGSKTSGCMLPILKHLNLR